MEKKVRIDWIDYCKAIGIILVSYGHIIGASKQNEISSILLMLCYAIELPLFYFMSGLQNRLFYKNISHKQFIKKRARRIIYPFFTMSLFYILFDFAYMICRYLVKGVFDYGMILHDLFETITLWGVGPLWFLPTLFFSEVICNYFIYSRSSVISKRVGGITICLLSCIGIYVGIILAPQYLNLLSHNASMIDYFMCYVARTLVAVSFTFIGYLTGPMLMNVMNKYVGGGYSFVLLIIGGQLATFNNDIVDLHFGFVRNPFITYISAYLLFLSICMLCKKMFLYNVQLKLLGQNTLTIMGLQNFVGLYVFIFNYIFEKFNFSYDVNINALISMLIFVFLCYNICKIINRKFPWMVKI